MTSDSIPASNAAANDNTIIEVVHGGKKYSMVRFEPANPLIEVATGEVDFGKGGLWIGFADLDPENKVYNFTKVRKVSRVLTEEPSKVG